jgi:hypothetical protein
MRTTTVVWRMTEQSEENLQATIAKHHNAAANIAGEVYRETIDQTKNVANGMLTITRAWPDAEKAQAWVDYVLSEGAVSAQVDPE